MIQEIIQGDCLEVIPALPAGCIDLILTDLPYGTTACAWDSVIDLNKLWFQFKRLLAPNGMIVLTAAQPFTTTLISNDLKAFKYQWLWKKRRPTGFANAKKRPLKVFEDILVFGGNKYNPQGLVRIDKPMRNSKSTGGLHTKDFNYGSEYVQEFTNYPVNILEFELDEKTKLHPTQKPVALMEYLIKTYSNEGDLVLDCTAGSGTTGVAAANTGRNFILIEKEAEYVAIAEKRIAEAQQLKEAA